MCAAGLIAAAAVPATANAGTTIKKRLHRADVALNKALDAADDGNDARTISGLKGANRQTNLALKSTLRLVVGDRRDADIALERTAEQMDTNATATMDILADASPDVVAAINSVLVSTDTGRGQILTTIQGLGDLEPDWADALTSLADDAVNELLVAADNYGPLSSDAEDALTAYAKAEIDAAGAIVTEVAKLADEGDAEIDWDLLDSLEGDTADAQDALDAVEGLSGGNQATIDEVVSKLGTLNEAIAALVDIAGGGEDDWYGYDDESYDDEYGYGYDEGDWYGYAEDVAGDVEDFVHGYLHGYADAMADWAWFGRGHGYKGWQDEGFGPGH